MATQTVSELKAYLRKQGLPVSGNKPDLIARVNGGQHMKLNELITTKDQLPSEILPETPLGEKLPLPSELKTGWINIGNIPKFTENELYNYLVLSKYKSQDFEEIGARRALKARVFYEDRHIHDLSYHEIDKSTSHCFSRGRCIPSYPTKDTNAKPDYKIWICMSKVTGRVHSAGCNCTAGAGGACNHIAAMLYALVDVTNKKETGELSSTSQACKWNQPRKRKLSPKKAGKMKFQKFEWDKTKRISTKNVANDLNNAEPLFVINIDKLKTNLSRVYPNAGWLLNFPKPQEDKENIELPQLHNIIFMYADHTDLQSKECCLHFEHYFNNLTVTNEEAVRIEASTRGQSTNSLWMDCRNGRLTASTFGVIVKRKLDTPPDNLLKVLLGYVPRCQTTAMEWGLNQEQVARESYMAFQRQNHPPLTVRESGFIVCKEYPYLGASPDGLIYCPHCPDYHGLLEIKCPYRWRNHTPHEAAKDNNFYCTITKTGSLKLKRSHSYYYQIQGQLALANRKWCDFVIWTNCGMTIERIPYNCDLWNNVMLSRLERFFKSAVLPELHSHRVKRNLKLYP